VSAIERLVARLGRMDSITFRREGTSLRVFPVDEHGFEVVLTEHDGSYTVSFDGWHEDFLTEEEAVECFAFGLTDACRLHRWSRGGSVYRWTVEAKTEDGWVPGSTTGLLLFPLFEGAERHILRNDFVRM
jgi:hypothetical protein